MEGAGRQLSCHLLSPCHVPSVLTLCTFNPHTHSCEPGLGQSLLHRGLRSLAPACTWVSSCVVHLSTWCLPSTWHEVWPEQSILETTSRLNDLNPPAGAELVDPVSLQEPPGLLLSILELVCECVCLCVSEGHLLLLPRILGNQGAAASSGSPT